MRAKGKAELRPSAQITPHHPLWLRLTAIWCVLACFSIGLVQACHNHDDFRSARHGSHVSALSDGDGALEVCPFCTGMHFCPPVLIAPLWSGRLLRARAPKVRAIAMAVAPLPFQLSSRPPPC